MSSPALISIILALTATAILGVGRLFRLEGPRRLRGPLTLVAATAFVQWLIHSAGAEGQWPEVAAAAVLIAVGFLATRASLLLVFEWFLGHRMGVAVPRLAQDIVAIVLYLIVTAAVLKATLALDVGTLLVSSAVITVVVGFALQETLGTLLAGLALAWERRLVAGSWVELDGKVGKVEELGWRSLLIRTRLGERILIPNSTVARERIRLLGSGTQVTAVPIRLGVSYLAAPHQVKEVLRRVAEEVPGVLTSPAPQILTVQFADSAIVYECRLWTREPWLETDLSDFLLTRAWTALARAGMEIPFPQRTVHMAPPRPARDVAGLSRAVLRRSDLFAEISEDAMDALAGSCGYLVFAPGEVVIREGDVSSALYVIAEGDIEVVKRGSRVATMDAGEVFGEIAFLMGEPRAATVRAVTAVAVVEADAAAIRALLTAHPEVAEELTQRVASRRKAMAEAMDTEATVRIRRGFAAELKARLTRLVSG